MIDIIRSKKKWDAVLKMVDIYDFYHTYDYHHIIKNKLDEPILVKYTEKDYIIAIPFLMRPIYGTPYYDLTSVYGYSGPITKNINTQFDNGDYIKDFKIYLTSQNIISIFSRLNPFIANQRLCIQGLGEITSLSKVVNIDLTLDLEEQLRAYHKRLRTHINKARRLCSIKIAESKEEVKAFIDLYYKTMERVNAKKYYFFDEKYFFDLLNSKDYNTRILLAIENETNAIVSGAMFITTNEIVQYHLSGTDEEKLDLYPNKLLIDEMRIIATQENCRFFNLGGGVGNQEDSLFHFKSGFSKDFKDFNLWKVIVNQEVYDQLTLEKSIDSQTNYFPLYRSLDLN
ncbi:peptidoglycan bridge formation glycyltransferase FemA/FemB family protein [Sediminicola luteus]|uniref:Peptidoglycan bridge formation glycyltransferase FemA/FemB family protein n=1 Tax=Sediminicola luteus TaxID=319238 RepID=A0ABV2TY86_9FLAO